MSFPPRDCVLLDEPGHSAPLGPDHAASTIRTRRLDMQKPKPKPKQAASAKPVARDLKPKADAKGGVLIGLLLPAVQKVREGG